MARRPSFQFYPSDWLASTKISMMTAEQEGAYIRLLCYCWNDADCSLPDDDQKLSVLSRIGQGWLNGGCSLVRDCFVPHPSKSGFLTNERLLDERKKQDEWRSKSSKGGRMSSELKKINQSKGGSSTLVSLVEPNVNSSSSSSSSNNNIHRFVPPSVDEVSGYCQERGNSIDPQAFLDYYEARGWLLKAGVKMKDWRAAIRTWESNKSERQNSKSDGGLFSRLPSREEFERGK